jgi:hypothetical protein
VPLLAKRNLAHKNTPPFLTGFAAWLISPPLSRQLQPAIPEKAGCLLHFSAARGEVLNAKSLRFWLKFAGVNRAPTTKRERWLRPRYRLCNSTIRPSSCSVSEVFTVCLARGFPHETPRSAARLTGVAKYLPVAVAWRPSPVF